MSDVAETSERALRALREESSGSGLLNAKIERTPTPPGRPSSPEQPCPICLGELNDKAVTDSCLHRFCFTCLCEWSKVKPECPLCKQRFTTIYHAIKSMTDFQEYRLDQPRPPQGMELGDLVSPIYINVAVQRQRFGYRTTMGLNRSGRHPLAVYWPASGPIPHPPVHHSMRVTIPPVSHASSSTSTRSAMQQREASAEFRRNVYRQNLWARANPNQDRVRESSPEFYRANLAQTHRLAPWLARELSVLLDVGVNFCVELACREILNGITLYPINSFEFKRLVTPYFGDRTNHFVHEFYHFAISPFDMHGYDMQARYTPSNAELEARIFDDNVEDDNAADVSELPLSGSVDPQQYNMGFGDMPGRPSIPLSRPPRDLRSSRDLGSSFRSMDSLLPLSLRIRAAVNSTIPTIAPEVIELSSGEENAADDNEDSEDEVLIIGSLPPRHLRTPEVITLDDSDDSDVIEIKPPTPPLIEIDDDTQPHSPSRPSTSNGIAGSSSSQVPEASSKRTARFFRPSYREYSSSSEEEEKEALPPKKRTPRKKNETRRSTRSTSKRTRSFKSSKYVDTATSDSDDMIEDIKDEDTGKKASKRKTKSVRKTSKARTSQSEQEDVKISKRSDSSNSRSSSKKSVGTDSDSCKSCSKCSKTRKKRKSRSMSSDSENTDHRPPKRKSKASRSESSGSTKIEPHSPSIVDVVGDEPVQNGGNFARNPKALSRKAILLGRNAEGSENTMPVTMNFVPSANSAFHMPGGRYSRTDSERFEREWPQEGSSDTNSSTLSMGKEFLPSVSGYDGQPVAPPTEPRSPSSMSPSTSSSSRRHYLDPPPESNDSWPVANRRSSSNSSPAITLDHSPLMTPPQLDDTTWDSVASPPRLKSIVLRVPSLDGDRERPRPPSSSSPQSSSSSSDVDV